MSEIGWLIATKMSDWAPYIGAFRAIVPGTHNITFLPPGGAQGDPDLIRRTADYMATQPFDVIVTATTEAALACKRAMPLPNQKEQFVFASVGDPMLSG
jgi:hypothetical protein